MRLAFAIASLGILGVIPMATAAMGVALLGVALASVALYQLRDEQAEVRAVNRQNRETAASIAESVSNFNDQPRHET